MELCIGQTQNPFLKEKSFYGASLQPFVVSEKEVTDINTEEDYRILCEN